MSNTVDFEKEPVALSREDWLQVSQDLMLIGPLLKKCMEQAVEQYPHVAQEIRVMDPEVFEADMKAACVAVAYVADCAAENVKFIAVKEDDSDG